MTDAAPAISILIPAWNEADWIGQTLSALLASDPVPGGVEIIVVANACTDTTVAVAEGFRRAAGRRGWGLVVLDLAEGGKTRALNAGDRLARGAARICIDADLRVDPGLIAALAGVLAAPGPVYAGGSPRVARAASAVTRAYGRFWVRLPFIAEGVPGCGIYAVNAAGRTRWGEFPQVIADDSFVRLNFTADERVRVGPGYAIPMPEGFAALVRVRRRQDAGMRDLARLFPELVARDPGSTPRPTHLAALALRDPIGFAVYAAVALSVRLRGAGGAGLSGAGWMKGR